MSPTQMPRITASSVKPDCCFSSSPAISMRIPGGRFARKRSSAGLEAAITSDESTPERGNAPTVMVRNWFRRMIFSGRIPVDVEAICRSGTFSVPCVL